MPSHTAWDSPPRNAVSWEAWPGAPRVVAEQLHLVRDPLGVSLLPLPLVSPRQAVGAIGAALRKPRAGDPAPDWLLPGQTDAFQQLLSILRSFNGALLAEPVGSGKTYIALAAAAVLGRGEPAQVFAPATLRNQWLRVSRNRNVPVEFLSHEAVSRGSLPGPRHSLVIIDESHHYRNPSIRRYQYLSQWLRGRSVLLMSATPVINSLTDLAAQLLLAVPDDALKAHGCGSIQLALEQDHVPAALGELMVSGCGSAEERPLRIARRESTTLSGSGVRHLRALDCLALSRRPPVAQLIRWVLYRALASSPAALLASLHRYQTLLLQACDAARAGITPDRGALRRWAGRLPDQLVLWELVEARESPADLIQEDRPALHRLIREVHADSFLPDPRAGKLRDLLRDNQPALVFTTHRETVAYLRQHLPGHVAWCTGQAAGWQGQRLARETVLGAFTPGGQPISIGRQPSILVTTDVTAEGLDLQAARRVVHYDLPWTASRLDQREGRVHRLGGLHESVEIIQFDPPPMIERRLAQLSIIERKRELPGRAGIGEQARASWTWRDSVARRFGHFPADAGLAGVEHREPGIVAAVRLHAAGLAGIAVLECWRPGRGWTEDPAIIDSFLDAASAAEAARAASPGEVARAIDRLLPRIRYLMRRAVAGDKPAGPAWQQRLLVRLRRQASLALRRRDARTLEKVDRAMGFVRQGHTAGEVRWLRGIEADGRGDLLDALARAPQREPCAAGGPPAIISILLFGPRLSQPPGPVLPGEAALPVVHNLVTTA